MLRSALVIGGLLVGSVVAAEPGDEADDWLSYCGGAVFGGCDTPPAMVDSGAVEYPDLAVLSGLGGEVVVEIAVLADGAPCNFRVSRGLHPLLDREVVRAARASTYRPALLGEEAVPGIVEMSYRFDLEAVRRVRAARVRPDLTDQEPLLSASPEAVAVDTPQGSAATFLYDGVEIRGDTSLQHVQTVMRLVRERMDEQGRAEEIDRITNLKDGVLYDSIILAGEHADWRADLVVETCRRRMCDGACVAGSKYSFSYDGAQFEFVTHSVWIGCAEDSCSRGDQAR